MKNQLFLITGVMASGKSTVAQLLAERLEKSVHLRGDIFRKMIVSGREEMSEDPSEEAVSQLHLRNRLTAETAMAYFDRGFSVVIQDNYYGEDSAEDAYFFEADEIDNGQNHYNSDFYYSSGQRCQRYDLSDISYGDDYIGGLPQIYRQH